MPIAHQMKKIIVSFLAIYVIPMVVFFILVPYILPFSVATQNKTINLFTYFRTPYLFYPVRMFFFLLLTIAR